MYKLKGTLEELSSHLPSNATTENRLNIHDIDSNMKM